MNDDTSLYGQDKYFAQIERQFGVRRGGSLMLSPRDWQRIEGWQRKEIPLEVVLRGINRAFDHFEASAGKTRRIHSLSYCEPHIHDVWSQAQELAAAAGDTSQEDPSAAHLLECAAACRRHAGKDQSSPLLVAAAALEELAQEAGSLSSIELDARATKIQQKLAASFDEGGRAAPLPPFSPWAV